MGDYWPAGHPGDPFVPAKQNRGDWCTFPFCFFQEFLIVFDFSILPCQETVKKMSSLLGIDSGAEPGVLMAAGMDIETFVRNRAGSGTDGDSGEKKKKKVSPFFRLMMKTRADLEAEADPRAGDIAAVRDLAGEKWQKMTEEERAQFRN